MDRWALEQAVTMLEAKTEQGHLSPEEERRIRELLASGEATRALESLADHDGPVDSEQVDFGDCEGEMETEQHDFAD